MILCALVLISSCIVVTENAEARKISDWSAPAPLQLAGNYLNASDPVVDMNDQGDAVAAWTTYDASSGTDLMSVSASVFTDGSWGPVTTISAPGTNSAGPEIAMNDNGEALVVWRAGDGIGSYYLQATSYIDGMWGEAVNISVPTGEIWQYSIDLNGNGNGALVWASTDYVFTPIMAAIYSDGIWSPGVTISSSGPYSHSNPAMALNPANGDTVFVWEQEYFGESMLAATTWSSGSWGPTVNITDDFIPMYSFHRPDVAMSGDGTVVVVAESYEEATSTSHIMVFQKQLIGGSWMWAHDYTDAQNMYCPVVKMNGDGSQLAIAWMVDSDPVNYMNATVYTAGSWSSLTRISSLSYDAYNLWLDINNAGKVIALWSGVYDPTYYVCASIFSDGAWAAADYISEGYLDVPRVAIDGEGCAIAVWYTMDPALSTNSVYYSIYIQTPSVTITAPSDGSEITAESVTVEWTGTNADYYMVSVNDAQPVNVGLDTSTILEDLEDGDYLVNVTAYNNEGKSSSAYVNFVVDTTAPTIAIANPAIGAWYNSSTMNVTWTVSDAGSGVANVSVSMDGGAWTDVATDYYEFTSLADGQHNVSVRAYDNAGNLRVSYKLFNIDTSLPVLSITDPEDGALINSTSVELVWEGISASPIGRYWLSVDGGDFINVGVNTSYVLSGLEEGEHTITLKARDFAGNYNTTSVEFTVDSVAPVIDITAPADGVNTKERNITVEWTIAESGSGMDSVEISVDGGDWTAVTESSFELLNLADGAHTFAVRATDIAGNAAVRTIEIVVDNEAPTATISPSGDDVAITAVITVAFSDAMNQTSVVITVEGPDSVDGTLSWNGNVATFTPSSPLSYDTEYAVSVTGKDLAGNEMVEMTSGFTTLKDEGIITGTVKDADGKAVANATVTLSNGMSATTDASGYFELTGVPSGSYTMNVTKDGFRTLSQTVNVVAGQTIALETMNLVSNASSGGDDGWMMGIVAVVAVAMLAIGFIVYRYKKK